MYDTSGNYSVCDERPLPDPYLMQRVGWLRAEITRAEQRARLLRGPDEESEARLMLDPMPTPEAFALLGMFSASSAGVIFFRCSTMDHATARTPVSFVSVLTIVCSPSGRDGARSSGVDDGLCSVRGLCCSASRRWTFCGGRDGVLAARSSSIRRAVGAAAAAQSARSPSRSSRAHRCARGVDLRADAWPLVFGVTGLIARLVSRTSSLLKRSAISYHFQPRRERSA